MTNEFSLLLPTIVSNTLIKLRDNCKVLGMVERDFANEVSQPGQTIQFKGRTSFTPNTPTPGSVSLQDLATTGPSMTLNIWKEISFALTDKEVADLQKNRGMVLTDSLEDAAVDMASYVTSQVLANFTGFFRHTGTNGTVPSAVSDITDIKTVAREEKWPDGNRHIIWDAPSEAKMLQLSILTERQSTGDNALQTGNLGYRYSFLHSDDNQVDDLSHTAGTQDGAYLVDQADVAVGDKSINIDTGTGTLVVGDLFTVAGDTQQYVVTAAAAGGDDSTLAFEPAAKVAWANNAAITFQATQSNMSLAFHRKAMGLAVRPLPKSIAPNKLQTIVSDPVSGLSLRLTIEGQHARDVWTIDFLGGTGVLQRELGCRVFSGT